MRSASAIGSWPSRSRRLAERLPGHVGHHEVGSAREPLAEPAGGRVGAARLGAEDARVDQPEDVRVLEVGGDPDLREEALSPHERRRAPRAGP